MKCKSQKTEGKPKPQESTDMWSSLSCVLWCFMCFPLPKWSIWKETDVHFWVAENSPVAVFSDRKQEWHAVGERWGWHVKWQCEPHPFLIIFVNWISHSFMIFASTQCLWLFVSPFCMQNCKTGRIALCSYQKNQHEQVCSITDSDSDSAAAQHEQKRVWFGRVHVLNVKPPGTAWHNSILISISHIPAIHGLAQSWHTTWGTWLTSACLAACASPPNIWFFRRRGMSKTAGYPKMVPRWSISCRMMVSGPLPKGYPTYPTISDISTSHNDGWSDRPHLSSWPSSWWKFDKTSEVWGGRAPDCLTIQPRLSLIVYHHVSCNIFWYLDAFIWCHLLYIYFRHVDWGWSSFVWSYDKFGRPL